jgi:TonB-dependent receptor
MCVPSGQPACLVAAALVLAVGWAGVAKGEAAGTIRGIVKDATTGAPVVGAGAEALGTGISARTGPSGAFTLTVPAGTHQVRIYAPFYRSALIEDVAVTPGGTATANASLKPAAASSVEVIEVVAEATKGSESGELNRRLQAPVVADTISAEIIRKLPGSDVASVAKRVPSVTIYDTPDGEKVICVRGLCNRYTIGLVDGLLLPSTNPVKRLVPAEIFPSEFLDSLAVYKSFLPNLRGNFQGAQVDFELRDPPEDLAYSLSASTGGNSQTLGKDFQTYTGSSDDYWGFGADYRNPPSNLPKNLADVSNDRRAAIGRSFHDIWNIDHVTAPPDLGLKGSVGNTIGPFGFLLAALYKNDWRQRRESRQTLNNDGTESIPADVVPDIQRSTFTTRLGGFLSTNLTLSDEHVISFRAFTSRRTQDEVARQFYGRSNGGKVFGQEGGNQLDWRLRYIDDQVDLGMLQGKHLFPWMQLDWRGAISRTTRNEPDTRQMTYRSKSKGQPLQWDDDSLSGARINNTTNEVLYDAAVDLTFPFEPWLGRTDFWNALDGGNLKTGMTYTTRSRDFAQRIFIVGANPATQDRTRDPESLFKPSNIGPGAASFAEVTRPTDAYTASEKIVSWYVMGEIPIIEDTLRLVGGVRVEDAHIELKTIVDRNPALGLCLDTNESFCPFTAIRDQKDLLPGASLIFSPIDGMNFRLAYSETVSRPEFRELAPTFFPAQRGQLQSVGNITLVQSSWTNYDARWEWLFGENELVSLSAFYKKGDRPIEPVAVQSAANLVESWINADQTTILGFEFEGRKNFGFVHPWLDGLSLSTNAAWFPNKQTTIQNEKLAGSTTTITNTKRAPTDVPDFIVNATLEYELPGLLTARLLYQTVGETLSFVGTNGVGDAFEQRNDQLDAVLDIPLDEWINQPLKLQLTAENLLNDQHIQLQDGFVTRSYVRGIDFGVSLTYSY